MSDENSLISTWGMAELTIDAYSLFGEPSKEFSGVENFAFSIGKNFAIFA